MKLLVLAAALMTSSFALAYPALNDSVTFTGTVVQGAQNIPVTLTLSLIQFDAAQNQFLEQQSITPAGGAAQIQTQWMKTDEMMTQAKVQQILGVCVQQGGHLEDVATGTETFHACALPIKNDNESSIYWIADVPFGIVRADISNLKDSSHTTIQIQSHSGM